MTNLEMVDAPYADFVARHPDGHTTYFRGTLPGGAMAYFYDTYRARREIAVRRPRPARRPKGGAK